MTTQLQLVIIMVMMIMMMMMMMMIIIIIIIIPQPNDILQNIAVSIPARKPKTSKYYVRLTTFNFYY